MEKTGTAKLLADPLLSLAQGWPVLAVLALMFGMASLLTQILSDAATTVLIGPIAIAIATALNLDPTPFVVCAALGAVASFLTPIGHHGNLLILNPGGYRFADFIRVGLPLTLLLCFVSAWVAKRLWLD
jgi:di/tricarboxylate transporter